MIVAIHQPNFFPWLGYFDKIRRADVFIFLDQVDYPRSGSGGMGSWVNRVRINLAAQPHWITCPLQRAPLGTPISEIRLAETRSWRSKLLRTLETGYRRSRNYAPTMELLKPLLDNQDQGIAGFNILAVRTIAAHLGLECRFLSQSELPHEGKATRMLISLVRSAGGTAYLAGGGASGYQDDELFAQENMQLIQQKFEPRPYGEAARFIPGLSVIDYLMQDGRPLAEAMPEEQC